jgi:phosphoserine phosphatase RsbU/P
MTEKDKDFAGQRIIAPMGDSSFRGWSDWLWYTRELRPGQPHLRVQHVHIYVRDQDQSLRFYTDQLGFELAADYSLPSGERFILVAPPDGSALLALLKTPAGSEEGAGVSRQTTVTLITEDLGSVYKAWSERRVRFHNPPERAIWGPLYTTFEDVDGNLFNLVEIDQMTEALEAERREVEIKQGAARRAAHEMAIAKEVQAKLFPQRQPQLKTLDYTGACIQARAVGGDYYDYLDLGPGRLGLVVGDVAGKGIAAALLMANLQANLRSHYGMAVADLETFLKSVNSLFHQNIPLESFATMVFAEYQDETRRLRYVNCGHLPPLLMRRDKTLSRLDANSTVLGMFEDWDCSTAEVQLEPGDTLLLYSDGVPDSLSDEGEEFGERRLAGLLRGNAHLEAPALLQTLIKSVQAFSGREQEDDITMVVARCREAAP